MRCLKDIRRGDTVDLTYSLPIAFGSTLLSIKAQIRLAPARGQTLGTLVDEFAITPLSPTITYSQWQLYVPPASTLLWPVGTLFCDILHETPAGDIVHTEKFTLEVGEAVTQA